MLHTYTLITLSRRSLFFFGTCAVVRHGRFSSTQGDPGSQPTSLFTRATSEFHRVLGWRKGKQERPLQQLNMRSTVAEALSTAPDTLETDGVSSINSADRTRVLRCDFVHSAVRVTTLAKFFDPAKSSASEVNSSLDNLNRRPSFENHNNIKRTPRVLRVMPRNTYKKTPPAPRLRRLQKRRHGRGKHAQSCRMTPRTILVFRRAI